MKAPAVTQTARSTMRSAVRLPAVALPAVVAALGCGVLAARPAWLAATSQPDSVLALFFAVLLVVGLTLPIPEAPVVARSRHSSTIAIIVGVVAFGAGRALISGDAATALTLTAVLANTLAAVAEEVWFRRLTYGWLAPMGPTFAVVSSSVLFAAVHISTYGYAILPLDLAAGALLGWQRAITGSWKASAVTHALANLFVLL